jgi:hypothetical protein
VSALSKDCLINISRVRQTEKYFWHEELRVLNKNVFPIWKYLRASEITKRDVDKLLDRIVVQIFGFAANMSCLNAVFSMDYFVSSGNWICLEPLV